MSADNNIGPRCGDASTREGAFQFPALDDTGEVLNLALWAGEYVEILWLPEPDDPDNEYDLGDAPLLYGFFRTKALAVVGFDPTTASVADGASEIGLVVDGAVTGIVATAPSRLESGPAQITVPRSHPFLRVEAEAAGSGLCLVRHAEGA